MIANGLLSDSPSLNLIIKIPGDACNFSCDYCFEHRKSLPRNGVRFVSKEQIVNIVKDVSVPVNIVFHGGEPLLAPKDYFRDILNELSDLKESIKSVQIQTNGSLLSQSYIDLFWGNFDFLNIEISISLDGNIEQNKFRKLNSHESYSIVRKAFDLLQQNGISAGLLSVIHRGTLNSIPDYVQCLDSINNVRFVKLNPLHLIQDGKLSQNSIKPTDFAFFIIEVFKVYLERGLYQRFPIEPCLSAMQSCVGDDSKFCNYTNRKCHNFVCIYPDKTLTLCDSLPFPDFCIDSIATRYNPLDRFDFLLSDCKNCNIYRFCKAGCLGIRYLLSKNPCLLQDYCNSKRMLFDFFSAIISEEGK